MKPNPDGTYERDTPGSHLVLDHYREAGLIHGWDLTRTERLCKLLNITPHELGRLCCIWAAPDPGHRPSTSVMQRYITDKRFPPYIALHFAILESWVLEHLSLRQNKPSDAAPQEAPKPIMPIHLLIPGAHHDRLPSP